MKCQQNLVTMALGGLVFIAELIILNPEIRNEADDRSPVRPSDLPCESMPLHNRVLKRTRCKGIADNKARHLVLKRLR